MGRFSAIVRWHPHPPFYYGWLLLGTAALGAFIATGVAQTVLGGVQDLIALDMGWDRTTIAFAATAGTWISGLTMRYKDVVDKANIGPMIEARKAHMETI